MAHQDNAKRQTQPGTIRGCGGVLFKAHKPLKHLIARFADAKPLVLPAQLAPTAVLCISS